MKLFGLFCFIGCTLFVNSKSVPSDHPSEVIFKNRENFANGFNGRVPNLDPLNVDTFIVVSNTPTDQIKNTIKNASFKGFTSFDKVKSRISDDGNFALQIHVPKVEVVGECSSAPAVLGVIDSKFHATLNDIQISIAGEVQKSKSVIKFNSVNVQIIVKAPTSNIELEGKNVTEEYLKEVKPFLTTTMGSLLEQATKVYQSEVSKFVTNYLNNIHALTKQHNK